jgi:hypothetical protein
MTYSFPSPTKHSLLSSLSAKNMPSLSNKIRKWLPNELIETNEPDWDAKFWTPIDLEVSRPCDNSIVILCQLDFRTYFLSPHKYSMFRDLVAISGCTGANRRRETLRKLKSDIENDGSIILNEPTGFIFHESRVGSTLVANNLGSDPFSLVFSESAPTANALLHCTECTTTEQINLFKDVVHIMGASKFHTKLFFKFQSITTTKISVALDAFPNTPWAFVYRSPVQTMMSHLDPQKGSTGAPCLRSMRSPPPEVYLLCIFNTSLVCFTCRLRSL